MPNPNAVVGTIKRVDRADERGAEIEFEDGRRVRIDPADRRATGFAEILEELRERGKPAYVEVDPQTGAISRLAIPRVAVVDGITPNAAGDLGISIPPSHARHILRRTSPDFEAWSGLLREAIDRRMPVILTEDDNHDVLDLRLLPNPEEPLPLPKLGPPPQWWRRWPWIRWPLRWVVSIGLFIKQILAWWLSAVTQQKANEMFTMVAGLSCQPLNPAAPCITFLYPDDGCYARAHEMCRLMGLHGVASSKLFNYGSLVVQTNNHPNCQVSWVYHVAPTLRVRHSFPTVEEQVIDPALFPNPVPKATWKQKQSDPSSVLVGTDSAVYYRSPNGSSVMYDPNYTDTNQELADFRLDLKARSLQSGPPPYANCP